MIKQHWTVVDDVIYHDVAYVCKPLWGSIRITIDGEEYALKSKFLFFGLARREAFRIGDLAAVLVVGKSGKAQVLIKGKPIDED